LEPVRKFDSMGTELPQSLGKELCLNREADQAFIALRSVTLVA